MSFLTISRYTLATSAVVVLAALALIFGWGPKWSIEFTGGTLMQLRLPEDKAKADLEQAVRMYDPTGEKLGQTGIASIRDVTGDSLNLRMKPISNEEHQALFQHLTARLGPVTELQFTTIGPSVSESLKRKAITAIVIASIALVLYLALAFGKLPRKLNPWKFGALAVVAFLHDVIITMGVFVVIGWFTSFEVDTLFVTALLTILAFSVNDTIVIFDRIRDNLLHENKSEDLGATVARGLRQCVSRTTHTTMSGLIMLFALFFLGSESIRWFILALIIGTFIGTYSSYFVAAPLLVFWRK